MKKINLIFSIACVGILGGCAVGQNDFNCSAGDENAICGSARAIYEATDGDLKTNDTLTYIQNGERKQVTVKDLRQIQNGDASHTLAISEISDHKANSSKVPHAFSYDGDVLRKDVRVMRIWIAPFVDAKDNLHMSSMVYTDIAQRSWEIGTTNSNYQPSATDNTPVMVTAPSTASSSPSKEDGKKQYIYSVPEKDKKQINELFKTSSDNGEK
ncbi:type IV conjugative transfer system lipoprotein TraV [Vibrio coralliilyticus]|uniref:Type IV conjugative transfer system lipoprotein TraV n=1 Tax=Vibrio coralliilyticus TaxID=190893 RepID=A0AAP7DFU6_9VIBR|nr:type IV conjugative transfer system lipoprotein TraV [Vibrio coralliilyticus]NOI31838.1 type IV conjugative transfer system lipoprotein TraV [Vibrio coralliilyticus]NOJ25282.1 type IV conjugative transfer system lipoprotein TraV [Vibrio coralliilyticus]